MKAVEIFRSKQVINSAELIEVMIWQVPTPVPPSDHDFKYSLVFIRDGVRVVGYDNERGKGDHKHIAGVEYVYVFTTLAKLFEDFEADVASIRGKPT
jgi:hypothetical protein